MQASQKYGRSHSPSKLVAILKTLPVARTITPAVLDVDRKGVVDFTEAFELLRFAWELKIRPQRCIKKMAETF